MAYIVSNFNFVSNFDFYLPTCEKRREEREEERIEEKEKRREEEVMKILREIEELKEKIEKGGMKLTFLFQFKYFQR